MLRQERRAMAPRWLVAVGLLVVVAAGYLLWNSHVLGRDDTYTTSKAQQRHLQLADGTDVELGAMSELSVHLTPRGRSVEIKEGEAFFQVKHDEARPFVVHAGSWQLTDVGTRFNVRKTHSQVVVAVAEGRVDVARPSGSRTMHLVAGDQVTLDASVSLANIEPAIAASWQQGQLRFQDEPLSVVLANVNRYSRHEIVAVDPEIGAQRFSGTVFIEHIDGWLTATCKVFALTEEHTADDRILLHR